MEKSKTRESAPEELKGYQCLAVVLTENLQRKKIHKLTKELESLKRKNRRL